MPLNNTLTTSKNGKMLQKTLIVFDDAIDEYIKVVESTTIQCYVNFVVLLYIDVFGVVYMRRINVDHVKQLLQMYEDCHGFFGMFGSLDACIGHGKITQ